MEGEVKRALEVNINASRVVLNEVIKKNATNTLDENVAGQVLSNTIALMRAQAGLNSSHLKEKLETWVHRFSDPKIPLGQHGASGLVIDTCEFDSFVKHLLN